MAMAICKVKGMRLQKPSPKNLMRLRGEAPEKSPARKTMSRARSAKTNASGNHRSHQSARVEPMRAKAPRDSAAGAEVSLLSRWGMECAGAANGISRIDRNAGAYDERPAGASASAVIRAMARVACRE